jgi:hemerythrin
MNEMLWKEDYCIGIEEIDKQHMDFIKLINRFNIIFSSGAHIFLQDRILLELSKYVAYHCVSEENLMIISKYPSMSIHQDEHKSLITTLQDKCDRLKTGNANGSDIIKYLFDWFLQHTQVEDRKFAKYIHERTKA